MGLFDLLVAYAIAQGSHTGGHFYQATNPDSPMRDISMRLDAKNLAANWETEWGPLDRWTPPKKGDKHNALRMSHEDYLNDLDRKATDIHGAGFSMQDKIRDNLSGKEREDVSKMNALVKLFYLAGGPQALSDLDGAKGDIKEMQKLSGNKYVPHMVGLTALSDLMQKGDSKASLGFRVENGQPGVVFNYKW